MALLKVVSRGCSRCGVSGVTLNAPKADGAPRSDAGNQNDANENYIKPYEPV